MQCPFCYPESDPEQSIVLANELCYFLQRPQPVLVGSGVIVPKKHRETVFDLTKDEWEATFRLLQEAKALLDSQYQPDGYNIGWNCGPVGGQEIFHAHLHVIPALLTSPWRERGFVIG